MPADQNQKCDPSIVNSPLTSTCVACKSILLPGASICPTCKSYQKPWRNHLQYAAGLGAFLTLILSLIAYMISAWPNVRKSFIWRENLQAVSLDSDSSIILANRGDGTLFVHYVALHMQGRKTWVSPYYRLNTIVAPGEFLVHSLKPDKPRGGRQPVRNVSDAEWASILDRAIEDARCFDFQFFLSTDEELGDELQMAGPTLRTIDLKGYIVYSSVRDGDIQRAPINAIGYVRRIIDSNCVNSTPSVTPEKKVEKTN